MRIHLMILKLKYICAVCFSELSIKPQTATDFSIPQFGQSSTQTNNLDTIR
jgi:hypothetical protein